MNKSNAKCEPALKRPRMSVSPPPLRVEPVHEEQRTQQVAPPGASLPPHPRAPRFAPITRAPVWKMRESLDDIRGGNLDATEENVPEIAADDFVTDISSTDSSTSSSSSSSGESSDEEVELTMSATEIIVTFKGIRLAITGVSSK